MVRKCGAARVCSKSCWRGDGVAGRCTWLLLMLLLVTCVPAPVSASGLLWELDASVGYLFVSEAQGTPWFSDTGFLSGALSTGGEAWAVGFSVDYATDSDAYLGHIPGFADTLEQIEKKLVNTGFRVFGRIFPGGRQRSVAPYLGFGIGPAITSVAYAGESTGREETDSVVRLSYTVSVGSKLRFGESPFSVFVEGSFGGLGALPAVEEQEGVAAPRKGLNLVCAVAGLGVTF